MSTRMSMEKAVSTGMSVEKAELFDDDSGDDLTSEVRINRKFAKKWDAKKDREELLFNEKRLREQGVTLDSDASTSESEDEDGALLNERVNGKFLDTLQKLRNKDPTVYDPKQTFFNSADFFEERRVKTLKTESGKKDEMLYRDVVRQTLLDGGAEAFEEDERKMRSIGGGAKMDERGLGAARAEILAADSESDGSEDNFLVQVKNRPVPTGQLAKKGTCTGELVKKVWKEEDLSEADRFLRDYIVNEGWKDSEEQRLDMEPEKSDEDSEFLDRADEFEEEHNFRFQEEGGCEITTHARGAAAANSVRKVDDKRKTKRKEREARKASDKIRRTEELKRLKALKEKEVRRRFVEVADMGGLLNEGEDDSEKQNNFAAFKTLLNTDFSSEKHDELMAACLGQEYDEADEELAEKALLEKVGENFEENAEEAQENNALGGENNNGGDNMWFLCDECEQPIKPGKNFYESKSRADFTLCQKCFKNEPDRREKFKRDRVPSAAAPPVDWVKPDTTNSIQNDDEKVPQQDVKEEDMYDLSNIGPVRFKYANVKADTFGLSMDDIMEKSDKDLNLKATLKKITRPFYDSSTYSDERTKKYEAYQAKVQEEQKKQKRAQKKKTGIPRDRMDAYKLKNVVLKK